MQIMTENNLGIELCIHQDRMNSKFINLYKFSKYEWTENCTENITRKKNDVIVPYTKYGICITPSNAKDMT